MSDGIQNFRAYDPAPKDRYGKIDNAVVPAEIATAKDIKDLTVTHGRLYGMFMVEMERQNENRLEMAIDEGFVDHEQWTETERELIEELGHVPSTINVVATTINWLLGTERRGRTDYKILPRRKEGGASAEKKSQLLKYIADVNRSEFAWSRAFADAMKAGVGWVECGVQADDEGEPIYERYESWRNILHDSAAQEFDLSDARFLFRFKWMDVDTAAAFFADKAEMISQSSENAVDVARDAIYDPSQTHEDYLDGYGSGTHSGRLELSERKRVRMIEAWVKLPVKEKRIKGGDFRGEIYDEYSAGHTEEIEAGRAEVVERVTSRVFVVIFTSNGIVWHSRSPYRHNQLPFTPIWAYRRASNQLPYGVVRGLRDLQRDVNKRHAHALFLLVSQTIIMDEGAVRDVDALEEEINRPTSIIEKRPGYHLELGKDKELSPAHLDFMSRSINLIQATSGVTDESLGRETNATSGRAVIARQEQGALSTAPLFDNLRFARQVAGEKMVSLMEQFMEEKKQFRITNKRGTPEYITINDGLPENDIIRTKADFIISEAAWQATLRRGQSYELGEFLKVIGPVAGPQVILATLDLVIESMDVPNGDEIVKRVRQITGMDDPDADPDSPDPERDARKAAEAEQQQYAKDMAQAELAKAQGDAGAKAAQADKMRAEITVLINSIPNANISQKAAALDLALALINAQAAAPTADAILGESGYQGADLPTPPAQAEAPMPMPTAPAPGQEAMPQEPQPGLPPQPQPMPTA